MTSSQITTVLGDSPTRSISLVVDVEADPAAFTPTLDWLLLLTAKRALTDVDSAAVFQLRTGAGITHTGSAAVCELSPTATLTAVPDNLYYDIRATHQLTGETHTVARGRWQLTRPATRLSIPSMPIYTTLPTSGPDLALMSGLGSGVKTAMAKEVGTLGSVQIYGEPMAPSAIILPDLTGTSPPPNAIGMVGGKLVIGNGSAVGGVLVAPRRFTGMSIVALNGQPKSKAFTKVFSIPMTAAEMMAGRKFRIMGHVLASPNTERGTVIPYTNQRMGWGSLESSIRPEPLMGFFNMWKALPLAPPATFNADYAANRLQRVRYDIATVLGHPSWPFYNDPLSGDGGDASYGVTYYNGGGMTTASAVGDTPTNSPAGIASQICWMWQVESAASANYTSETMIFEWDVEIQTII